MVAPLAMASELGKRYPICLAGKRVCPPEDCGGIWGYADFLEATETPQHPEHEAMLEWIGASSIQRPVI